MGAPRNLDAWEPRGVRQPLFQNLGPSCVTLGPTLSLSELQVPVKMGMAMPHSISPHMAPRVGAWPEAGASSPETRPTFSGKFKDNLRHPLPLWWAGRRLGWTLEHRPGKTHPALGKRPGRSPSSNSTAPSNTTGNGEDLGPWEKRDLVTTMRRPGQVG